MTRTTRTGRSVAPLVAGLALLSACGDDTGDSEDSDPSTVTTLANEIAWPGDGSPTETIDVAQGLVADLPESWEIEHDVTEGDCPEPRARLDTGGGLLWLEMPTGECVSDTDDRLIGNGYHGTYVTLDDVPEPLDAEDQQVAAGALTTFVQDYFECTNECNDYQDNVGLLALDSPPDPDRPTVVLLDDKGQFPREELVALADAIRVKP